MGVATRDDDDPWDFGSGIDYPVLRGVGALYSLGNTTSIRVQRELLSSLVLATLSRRGGGAIVEGSTVTYAVELGGIVEAATMSWSVELTGVGMGHAEASDFGDTTRGRVVFVNTDGAVFRIGIRDDGASESRETYRVRLHDLQGPANLRLSVASSAVVSIISPRGGTDYDPDNDDLIDVATTSQLAAIRYDLRGWGRLGVDDADLNAYDEAFPSFDESETCPAGCKGYELLSDVDLSEIRNWTPIGGGDTQRTGTNRLRMLVTRRHSKATATSSAI